MYPIHRGPPSLRRPRRDLFPLRHLRLERRQLRVILDVLNALFVFEVVGVALAAEVDEGHDEDEEEGAAEAGAETDFGGEGEAAWGGEGADGGDRGGGGG